VNQTAKVNMKEKFIAGLAALALAVAPKVLAQPADVWENNGLVTAPPQIDALNFINDSGGFMDFSTVDLFDMSDTLNFTNNGQMILAPGLDFRTKAANLGLPKMAASFANNGNGASGGQIDISGFSLVVSNGFISSAGAAKLLVSASNIVNSGTILIDATSVVNMDGKDIDLTHGTLANGQGSTQSSILDGYWGIGVETNLINPAVNFGTSTPSTPQFPVTLRSYIVQPQQFFFSGSSNFVFDTGIMANSNRIVDAIFVQNIDPRFNITAYFPTTVDGAGNLTVNDLEVQWAWTSTNRVSGGVNSNFVQLFDNFGENTNFALIQNGRVGPNPTFKPTNYNIGYSPFANPLTPAIAASGAPTNFPNTLETNQFAAYQALFSPAPSLTTDVAGGNATNVPGRIEVTAANTLDLSNAIISSVNYLLLGASNHYKGNQNSFISSPTTDLHLRTTNGLLSVTNLVAPFVNEISGPVDLYSARFTNLLQFVSGTGTNATTNTFTNTFHILFVDSQLHATTTPEVQTLELTVTNAALAGAPGDLFISDVLNVSSNLSINAKSVTLTANGSNSFSPSGQINIQNQNILWSTATPGLLHFTNSGQFTAENAVFFGGSHAAPPFDFDLVNVPYLTFVNHGLIANGGSLVWSGFFESDGLFQMAAPTLFENFTAATFRLQDNIFAILKNGTNDTFRDSGFGTLSGSGGSISFESSYLLVSNHIFLADSTISLTPTNILEDGAPNLASFPTFQQQLVARTNLTTFGNIWECSDLTMQIRPAVGGDLLATLILGISPSNQVDYVTWAAEDRGIGTFSGNSSSGYFNNQAVGFLWLFGEDLGSKYVFRGPDANNRYAIYVDELVLDGSFMNYLTDTNSSALQVASNMKVYFADATQGFGGPSVAQALNGRAGGGFIWVSNYNYGYYSSAVQGGRLVNSANPNPGPSNWTPAGSNVPSFPEQPFFAASVLHLPPVVVGHAYSATLADLAIEPIGNSTLSFAKVSGPEWLNVAANGMLSGTPTNTDAGTNMFVFSVTAPSSLSASATGVIIVSTNNPADPVDPPAILANFPALSADTSTTAAGSYYGLVSDTNNGISAPSSGAVTINVTARKNYTAKVLLAGHTFSFSGSLATGSSGSFSANNGSLLKLQLQQSGPDQIHGSVSNLNAHWSAGLLADRLVFNKTKNPAPSATYTMVIPPDPASPGGPDGYGSGTVKVDAAGHVIWAGTLADGSKMSQGSAMSKEGYWPLFNSLYGGRGLLIGWMQFTNQAVNGTVDWLKPRGTFLKSFSNNFTNTVTATGVIYKKPAHGSALNLTSGTLNLSGGTLLGTNTVVCPFTLDANNRVHSSANLKLNIKPGSGLMSGTVIDPLVGRVSFQGVLLQSSTNGFGFFLDSDQSGQVNLAPAH
jgi:hypothetical protein